MHVSITGLRLNSALHLPTFWWHAIRSMRQAQRAPGLIRAEARRVDGVHHTLTIWESEAAMRAYLASGPHLSAMKTFRRIATGRTVGYNADRAPDWEEARSIWHEKARVV
jgi:heme-degrading monooxygenase HmoA